MPNKSKPHIAPYNVEKIRKDFPILSHFVNKKPLVYFDNGATTHKPQQVISRIQRFYTFENSNIHRGVHALSRQATDVFENARKTVQQFINAAHSQEIIFTSGTTESINLVASSFGKKFITSGDEILISEMEHHSNILPWQMLCKEKGAILKVIPVLENGELNTDKLITLFSERTKLVSITHVSNALGSINPVKEIIALAQKYNVPVLIDGAQSVPHLKIDVLDLDCDFFCFSAHKMYGPTGIGVLYGKEKWLNELPPYQTGGGTIKTVSFHETEYADLPLKFEAGTPHIAGVVGLEEAIQYVEKIGIKNISAYENFLLIYATEQLKKINRLKIIGEAEKKAGVISFVIEGTHPFDVGTILDQQGIAVRTGHHCTQPLMQKFGISGTVRVSLAMYNTKEEIDFLISGIQKAVKMLL
ncbi:MAG: cysteine desulfurase [Bacteroidetes bacterium]|nr:cysteine desulfurase [Bacteroidota bacterium]MCL4816117.1 cysteine desulfurase [Flavobacteriales bacterium]NOG95276.1 cysteine desulfurase [Bacteroidota bacterium]WKZ76696.1 MAG: cysteine desulfurase [Vicingaceae bacterium]GIK69836.1 MAG: cysteine desulfurase [Bacteroidota bacterium]